MSDYPIDKALRGETEWRKPFGALWASKRNLRTDPDGTVHLMLKSPSQSASHTEAWKEAIITPASVDAVADLPVPVQFVGVVSCEPGPDFEVVVDDPELGAITTKVER